MIVLSAATFAFAQPAHAQAKKLFFEGDIVRHAIEGQQGPFCVLANQFKRKEAVAWRIRIMQASGQVADAKALKSVTVVLGNGEKLPAKYGPHPPRGQATDTFWSLFWTIPGDFPTGSLGYKVVATMNDGTEETWSPFNRPSTQLSVIAGEPAMAPPGQKKQ
jgi:hypothetical protein